MMKLKELVGEHMLDTAAVIGTMGPDPESSQSDNRRVISFGLDGKTFTAIEEDLGAGRSSLDRIAVEDGHTEALQGATLVSRPVIITHQDNASQEPHGVDDWDIIVVTDRDTAHIWLRLGTEGVNDDYPSCIFDWTPAMTVV
jgi:hypothetical protein